MADYSNQTKNEPTLLDWLKFAYTIREANKGGSFVVPPMTPEQKQMFDRVNRLLDSTPQASSYTPILGYDLAHPATLDMAALKRGDIGFTPAQHMSPEELAKVLAGAKPSGGGPPPGTTPPPGTANGTTASGPTGVPGDAFGHVTSPAGSQNDPFKNWPDPSGTAHNVTWDDIKKYGPQALSMANAIVTATPGVALTTVYNIIRKMFGSGNQPPPDANPGGWKMEKLDPNYKPMFGDPNRQPPPTYQQLGGQEFINSQNYGLANAPGQITPGATVTRAVNDPSMLGMADLTKGFGYGMDYNSFYGGGGGDGGSFGQLVKKPGKLV